MQSEDLGGASTAIPDAASAVPDTATNAYHVPRRTTPVWESELLLSIGLIVGLFQLPELIDGAWLWFWPRLSDDSMPMLIYGFLFAKTGVYALLATFVIHLLLRGFWVATLGARAVFPDGPDWSQVKFGPMQLEATKRQTTSLDTVVEQCDNAASLIFALGFVIFGMTLSSGLGIVVASVIAALLAPFAPEAVTAIWIVLAVLTLLVGPYMLAFAIDRYVGKRIDPRSRIGRIVDALVVFGTRQTSWPVVGPLMRTLTTRMGRRRGSAVVLVLVYALFAVVVVQLALLHNGLDLDSYRYIAREKGLSLVEPIHYADQRLDDTLRFSLAPQIQSAVVTEPFVRLFVPFHPRRMNEALAAECPGVARDPAPTFAEEATRREQVLACAARVYDPRINGVAISGFRFDFGADAATSLRGFVAFIPTAGLAEGRHTLSLRAPPHPDGEPLAPDDDGRHHIPFWRGIVATR